MFPSTPEELRSVLQRQGILLAGVAAAEGNPDEEARYREQIARGFGGEMAYLERHAPLKFAPAKLLQGCRSIICVGLGYYVSPPDQGSASPPEPAHGRIARYAWGRDYHKVLGDRLRAVARTLERRMPGERFAPFTDATPLAERYYAEQSGLGFTGRNGLLIASSCGSWLVLGEILTTLPLPSTALDARGACPASCRRCIAACPTRALGDHRLDARRCISFLTIENKGPIPTELRPLVGDWLFGCDLCQEACPFNARPEETGVEDFRKPRAGPRRVLAELLALRDHAEVARAFAGSPLVRAGRRGLVRNACVVAANTGAAELLPALRGLQADADPVVAEHAAWAVAKLQAR